MNLIICTTPFQVLVAEKIIEKYPEKSFFAMMIIVNNNQKYQYYANRLLNKCGGSGDIYVLKKQWSKIFTIIDLLSLKLKGLKLKSVDNIYLASFDSILIQTFISGLKFKNLYTFDDGTANIVSGSIYNQKEKYNHFMVKLFKILLQNPYSLQVLKEKSIHHYTVYPLKNVMGNTVYIPFYKTLQVNDDEMKNEHQIISFLLGQPIYELDRTLTKQQSDEKNTQLAKKIIEKYSIDYYFPHPRESYFIENVEYVKTELVAEDYFFKYLDSKKHYVFFTLGSGAIFSLLGLDFVDVICLKPTDLPTETLDIYELMESSGINIIDI